MATNYRKGGPATENSRLVKSTGDFLEVRKDQSHVGIKRTGDSFISIKPKASQNFRPSPSTLKLFEAIEEGLPVSTLSASSRQIGVPESRLRDIARISSSTFARRQRAGKFSPEESDRLSRVIRVAALAQSLFNGDSDAALAWLTEPAPALHNRPPIELLRNDHGAVEVERLIRRIEHGVFT